MKKDELIDGVLPIEFPVHSDSRGSLVALDHQQSLPFEPRRAYCIFEVPAEAERAGRATSAESVFVAVHGAVEIEFDNGRERERGRLDDPARGFYVRPGVIVRTRRFSHDAVFMVLSSLTCADATSATEPFFYRRSGAA